MVENWDKNKKVVSPPFLCIFKYKKTADSVSKDNIEENLEQEKLKKIAEFHSNSYQEICLIQEQEKFNTS